MNLKALAYKLRLDTVDLIRAGKAGHISESAEMRSIRFMKRGMYRSRWTKRRL